MSRRDYESDAKVYVGGLPADATAPEVEDVFHKFGSIRKVWVAHRPPGFAFVEFEDRRDAEDACRELDGSRICGVRARVQISHGRRRGGGSRGGGGYSDRAGGYSGGGGYRRSRSRSRSPPPPRNARYSRSRSISRSPRRASGGGRSRSRSPIAPMRRSRSPSRSPLR